MQPSALVRSDHAWLPARATVPLQPFATGVGNPAARASVHVGAPTPTRIGGAPLTGALGVDAYRGTAQALELGLVGRIDVWV
jgi:hypothetical protein